MSQDRTPSFEPCLAPDFAQRVLREVDLQLGRRRRIRRASAGFAVVSLCAVAIVAGLGMRAPTSAPVSGLPVYREASELQEVSSSGQINEMDALSDLFPDAGALATFDNQYAQTNPDADTLFEDETQDVQDDSNLL